METFRALRCICKIPGLLTSAAIIVSGMVQHLDRTKSCMKTPDAASSLFALSLLCIFVRMRKLWSDPTGRIPVQPIFMVELPLILCATEFLMCLVWLPFSNFLNFLCSRLGQYAAENEEFFATITLRLATWVRVDGFRLARFLMALVSFICMIDVTGFRVVLEDCLRTEAETPKDVEHEIDESDVEHDLVLKEGKIDLREAHHNDGILSNTSAEETLDCSIEIVVCNQEEDQKIIVLSTPQVISTDLEKYSSKRRSITSQETLKKECPKLTEEYSC